MKLKKTEVGVAKAAAKEVKARWREEKRTEAAHKGA